MFVFLFLFLEYSMPPKSKWLASLSCIEIISVRLRCLLVNVQLRKEQRLRSQWECILGEMVRASSNSTGKKKKKKKVTRFHSVFPETPLGAVSQYTAVGFPPPTTSCKGYVGLKAEGSTHAGNDAAHGGINEKPQRGESFHTEAQLKGNL